MILWRTIGNYAKNLVYVHVYGDVHVRTVYRQKDNHDGVFETPLTCPGLVVMTLLLEPISSELKETR